MDTIAFKEVTPEGATWPTVDIYINDRNLIEIVHEVELPYAVRENHPDIAGRYMGLPPHMIFLPSRHLLGGHAEDILDTQKTEIFACGSCGEIGCWPLLVQIDIGENTVMWHDFEQPYRGQNSMPGHWQYEQLGPFEFDKEQYLSALAKPQ